MAEVILPGSPTPASGPRDAASARTPDVIVGPCDFGLGVFAKRDFQPGEIILIWDGVLLDLESCLKLGELECYPLQVNEIHYIDPQLPARFLNHSCDPNAGLRRGVVLHALTLIQTGEEIRFDYSTTMSEQRWTMECRCGAPSCRGIIRDFHELPPEVQNRYLELDIVSPFIVEEVRDRRGSP